MYLKLEMSALISCKESCLVSLTYTFFDIIKQVSLLGTIIDANFTTNYKEWKCY